MSLDMKKYVVKVGDDYHIIGSVDTPNGYDEVYIAPLGVNEGDGDAIKITEAIGTDGEPYKFAEIDGEVFNAKQSAKATKESKEAAAASMISDIYADLDSKISTKRIDTATADVMTWLLMSQKPELFSSKGILCDREVKDAGDVLMFSEGDALDTDQKILDYSGRMLEIIADYGAYRMARKKQYKDAVAAL